MRAIVAQAGFRFFTTYSQPFYRPVLWLVNNLGISYAMPDPRYDQLARQLCRFSTCLQKGERVLIDSFDLPAEMTIALVRAVREAGAFPFVQIHQGRCHPRTAPRAPTKSQYELLSQLELARMQQMDAYIAFRASHNITELSDVPNDRMALAMKKMRPGHRPPRQEDEMGRPALADEFSMAQQAGMSTEAFEDFYFRVCLLDYEKMIPGMAALKERIDRTDLVEITGPGTALRFSDQEHRHRDLWRRSQHP